MQLPARSSKGPLLFWLVVEVVFLGSAAIETYLAVSMGGWWAWTLAAIYALAALGCGLVMTRGRRQARS
jgi:hypothetical protein